MMQEIKTFEYLKPLYVYKCTHCIIEGDIEQRGWHYAWPRVLWCTNWKWSEWKDCIALCYMVPAGCLNDGTQQFNLRAKIEYGIKKKNRNLWDTILYTYSPFFLPLLSSLECSHHLDKDLSCAPSMPSHHVGTDLLNISFLSLSPKTSRFPFLATCICCVAKTAIARQMIDPG